MLVSRFPVLRRLTLVLVVASCALLSAAASSNASPGGLKVLVTGNCGAQAGLATAIQTLAGGATVTTFDTSTGTLTAAMLKSENLVVSTGDSSNGYADAATISPRHSARC